MEWKKYTGKYQCGVKGYAGKIAIADVYYNSLRSKDDPKDKKAVLLLPGFKKTTDDFLNEEEAKVWCESMFDKWCEAAGLLNK